MSRRKLQKFSQLQTFRHVYESFDTGTPTLHWVDGQMVEMAGRWQSQHFGNENPITLELACGGGEYTVALAEAYPDRNFIGVDIKGNRIWKGASQAMEHGLNNAAFLRTRIELITPFFAKDEVSEIWITFPDPFLRESKENRRLTSPPFRERYRNILKPGGIVHLKTDSPELYDFSMETISADPQCHILYHDDDIYAKPLPIPELDTKTRYEGMHLQAGKTIKYIRFTIH
jgi:tRNA (guanine-N7-)-methyltransferase